MCTTDTLLSCGVLPIIPPPSPVEVGYIRGSYGLFPSPPLESRNNRARL